MADQPKWRPLMQQMNVDIEEAFKYLQNILEDFGFTSDTQYYDQTYEHMKSVLVEMIGKAQSKRQRLLGNIQNLEEQRTSLYAELQLDMTSETHTQVPLYMVHNVLWADVQNLKRIKKKRMRILEELDAKRHDLCKRLDCEPLSSADNVLPSEQALKNYKLYLQEQEKKIILADVMKMTNDLYAFPSLPFQEICNNFEEFVRCASKITELRKFRDNMTVKFQHSDDDYHSIMDSYV